MAAKNNYQKVTANEVQTVSKTEAKNAILAKLANEVSLNKFCKLMQELKQTEAQTYKNLLLAYNLSENFEFSFDWFKANTPNINGKFAYWKKTSEKLPANENKDYNRITKNGVTYTLVEYNVQKANYGVFLQMFSNTVKEINRINREKAEAQKAEAKTEAKTEAKAKQSKKAKLKAIAQMSDSEKLEYLNKLSDSEKLELFS